MRVDNLIFGLEPIQGGGKLVEDFKKFFELNGWKGPFDEIPHTWKQMPQRNLLKTWTDLMNPSLAFERRNFFFC